MIHIRCRFRVARIEYCPDGAAAGNQAMTMTDITVVTQNASHDSLSETDYRDIYEELRQRDAATGVCIVSIDRFRDAIGSAYSKALWAKYDHGVATLNRTQRNELRAAVGLPVLPPTLIDVAQTVDPDATVWQIGETPDRVVLIGRATDGLFSVKQSTIRFCSQNGVDPTVTTVTRAARKRLVRPVATPAQNERRLATGATWTQIIEAGLRAIETT